jgi:hypothetical protein
MRWLGRRRRHEARHGRRPGRYRAPAGLARDATTPDAEAEDVGPKDAAFGDAADDAGMPDSGEADAGPTDAGFSCAVNDGGCDVNATCTSSAGNALCACNAGYVGDGRSCLDVAGSLSGLRWELPCTGPPSGNNVCATIPPVETSTVLGGLPGIDYDVTLRFRGVIEEKTYSGGTNDGAYFQIGGTFDPSGFNVYEFEVSDPSEHYYVNRGSSDIYYCFGIDYSATVRVQSGATVTLRANAYDGAEIANEDSAGVPIVIPDIPPAPSPYDGQFVQMDVVSIRLAATVGAPCTSDGDCIDGTCLALPNGYCTRTGCDTLGCPSGSVCFVLGGGQAACFRSCDELSDCRFAEGYVCDADNTCYP